MGKVIVVASGKGGTGKTTSVGAISSCLRMGMPLEEIIRRNTAMVADHFDITDRGRLEPGKFADLAVIDLESYAFPSEDEITPLKPLAMASGVDCVLVNGVPVLKNGEALQAFSGRVLRHES